MDKILSISVAAYNVENFIKLNLDSFVNSDVRDYIEVLVTDDESKDKTTKIVSEYENKYPGVIKLIRQKNAGPGSTVNSGIKNASGKYFRMVDGDDWVDTENLKEYIEFLKNNEVDMIVTNYTTVDNETGEKKLYRIENKETNKVLDFEKECKDIDLQMHNVTFKTEILKDNNITLDNGFYTDVEYLLLPFEFIKTIAFLDLNIYMYRISLATQSVSLPSKQKNIEMHDLVLKRLVKYYQRLKEENKTGENIQSFILNRISDMAESQFYILLSFKPEKKYKIELKNFIKYIKNNCKEIYNTRYSKMKMIKGLEYSSFMLYNYISNVYRKRNNLM